MNHPHPDSAHTLQSVRSSRGNHRLARQCLIALAATLATCGVKASEIDKANNTDNLNLTASWVGGVLPGPGDIATWNSTVTSPNTISLGASTAWQGIKITNPGGPVMINADGNTLTNGAVSVVGNVGMDMSAATQDLTLSNNLVVNGLQDWNIASGRTLTVGGSLARNEGGVIRFNLADATSKVVITNGSDVVVANATPNAMLGGISAFGNNYFGTVNDTDYAALIDAAGGGLQIASGSTVGGLYTANGSGNTDPGNCNVLDFITDDPAAFGQRASNTRTWLGMRFNIPQANSLFVYNGLNAWEINIPSGRTVTCNNVLITTNVGSSPILINNGGQSGGTVGNFRIGSGGAQDMLIYQNNPAAPLVIQPNINLTQQGTGSLVKMGAGTMIVQSPNVTYVGGTKIYGGTLLSDSAAGLGVGPLNVFGGRFAQSSLSSNRAQTIIYTGATNSVMINAANGSSSDSSNVTFYAGTHLQFVYSNSIVPSATSPALIVTNVSNGLTASNTVVVDMICGELSVGQFPLIRYSGAIGGDGGNAFVLGVLEPHAQGYISNNVGNSSIDLVVTNITQPIKWTAGNGTWDVASSLNWVDTKANPTTYQEDAAGGDNVIFDDSPSGAGPFTVTLNTNPAPGSVTFNNNSKNYTLSGNGSIVGVGGLSMTGSGSVSLQTTNYFTGGIFLDNGLVNFLTLSNLGAGPINFGGGTLQFGAGNTSDISVDTVNLNAGGAKLDLNGNTVAFAHPIGNGGAGGLTLTNGTLQVNGTNKYAGNTAVSSGSTLALASANTYVSNSAALVVNGTLDASAATVNGVGLLLSTPASQQLVGTGTVNGEVSTDPGTTISPATNGVAGTLTIAGDLTVNGGTIAMDIAGPTGASKDRLAITTGTGTGNLTLNSGLNAGTLQLNVTGTLNNGVYPLITYQGGLNGVVGNLNLSGFNQSGSLAYLTAGGGAINLNVIPGATNNLTWGGQVNGIWDNSNTANWVSNGVTGQLYQNGDKVTFDDTGVNTTISLGDSGISGSGAILPGAVTVNATNNNYTFQDGVGDGSAEWLGPMALTINSGSANVTTLLTVNGYSGPTTVNGGTLQVGNGAVTGDIGTGVVTNNGTLVFDQTDSRSVAGQIVGSGALVQEGASNLIFLANNSYTGPTTIAANSSLQVGTGGTVGTLGTGAVTNNGTLFVDRSGSFTLNNGVSGSGSVIFAGGATFSLSGTLAWQGNTYLTNGTIKLSAANQIPSTNNVPGSTGILGLAGTLDLNGFNQSVNGLTDLGLNTGRITNSAASGTGVLTIGNALALGTSTYTGSIIENTNRGHVALAIVGPGDLTLANVNNNYSGGTFVGGGATLRLGTPGSGGIPGNVAAGTGTITMSNNTALYMNGNVITFPANPLTIAPGATVSFSSQSLGDQYSGLISGDAASTNIITGPWTAAGPGRMWNGFLGTVLVPSGGQLRVFGNPGGGTNATFDLEGTGQLFTRTIESIFVGKLVGTGSVGFDTGGNPLAGGIVGPSAGSTGNIIIGTANADSIYRGTISGANNIYKAGTGKLTLEGSTNVFNESIDGVTGLIDTNYFMTNGLFYVGATVVSNGVLAIVAPANLNGTNFTSFTLASSSATLDLSSAGSTPDGVTLVTNSTLQLGSGQTLTGLGTINGSLVASNGSTVSAGLPGNTNGVPVTGALNITGSAELGGAIVLNICTTNSPNSGEIVAPTITIDPTATLVVTNLGPESGATFHLFSKPVSGFTSVTLPALTGTNSWINNLSVDGTITLVAPPLVNTTPTNILFSVSGGNLTLSWPADHTGWTLQAQTNPIGGGLGSNWVSVPGSTGTDSITAPVNTTNNVFFRLRYP